MIGKVLTIMITDIKGFTERTSSSSREEMHRLLDDHEGLLLPLVTKFHGRLVKTLGDSLMVTFESPTNAVLCAVMMQDKLKEFNEDRQSAEHIEIRVALNAGEVELRAGDIFGEAVNVTARIEGITEAGEIYFTEAVYLAMNKSEVPSSEVGVRRLKGLPEPIKVYKVIQDRNSDRYLKLLEKLKGPNFMDAMVPSTGETADSDRPRKWLKAAGVILVMAAAITTFIVVSHMKDNGIEGMSQTVAEALEQGDIGRAYSCAEKMMEQFPADEKAHEAMMSVVIAEVRQHLEKGRIQEASDLLAKRKEQRPYIRSEELEKEVLLVHAKKISSTGNKAGAEEKYRELIKRYPDDLELMLTVVNRCGSSITGVDAALAIVERTEGPLDDAVGRALLDGLARERYGSPRVTKMRKILASRYPAMEPTLRQWIGHKRFETRNNAYLLLKETGNLTDEQELRYHFRNLILIHGLHRSSGTAAMAFLEKASKEDNWAARKKAAGIKKIDDVAALHSWSDYQKRVSAIIAKAFMPEAGEMLRNWVRQEDIFTRTNAFRILKQAGEINAETEAEFHRKTLVNPTITGVPEILVEAVEYFKTGAGSGDKAKARAALSAGVRHFGKMAEYHRSKKDSARAGLAEKCVALMDEAIRALR